MRPDFTGEYALNRAACRLSAGAAAIQRGRIQIEHTEPRFHYEATFDAGGAAVKYAFDRMTDGHPVPAADGEVSTLAWDGDALIALDRIGRHGAEVTMSWRYRLVDGGRRLEALEQRQGSGHAQENLWVFDRR